jgi:hypothetical protein
LAAAAMGGPRHDRLRRHVRRRGSIRLSSLHSMLDREDVDDTAGRCMPRKVAAVGVDPRYRRASSARPHSSLRARQAPCPVRSVRLPDCAASHHAHVQFPTNVTGSRLLSSEERAGHPQSALGPLPGELARPRASPSSVVTSSRRRQDEHTLPAESARPVPAVPAPQSTMHRAAVLLPSARVASGILPRRSGSPSRRLLVRRNPRTI